MKTGILRAALAAGMSFSMLTGVALAQEKVLRVAMTAADIPRTHGQPDQASRATGSPASRCSTR